MVVTKAVKNVMALVWQVVQSPGCGGKPISACGNECRSDVNSCYRLTRPKVYWTTQR